MGKETNPKINIWAKHAQTIKNHKVKTIKTLVAKLKPGAGKIPLIKGIGKNDAVAMLIDIGLSAVPFAVRYKNKLLSKFKNAPEKVDYKTLLSSLEEITREEDINEKERSYIEEAIEKAKSSKDPFNDNILLSEHRITAPIFRKTIIDEIASTVKLKEEEILKLKQTYKSLKILIDSKNAQIKKATGIEVEKIKKIKAIVNWTEFEHVSVPIAHAFVIKKVEPQTIIETSTEDVQKIVKDSGITTTRKELNDIGKVIDAVRTKMPAEAYYFDVISALNLPKKAASILENKKIRTFSELRKNGLIDDVIKKGKIEDKELIQKIKAYNRLENLSKNYKINTALISNDIISSAHISRISKKDFIEKFKNKATQEELEKVHNLATNAMAKFVSLGAWANMSVNEPHLNKVIQSQDSYKTLMSMVKSIAPPTQWSQVDQEPCECIRCGSVYSPAAYLLALVRFIEHYFSTSNQPKDMDYLFGRTRRSELSQLPIDCEEVNRSIPQPKIAIKILKEYLINSSAIANESEIYRELGNSLNPSPYYYYGNKFKEYLTVLGTSLLEVHSAFQDPTQNRYSQEYFAEILGITMKELKIIITPDNYTRMGVILERPKLKKEVDFAARISDKDFFRSILGLRKRDEKEGENQEPIDHLLSLSIVGTSGDVIRINESSFNMMFRLVLFANVLHLDIVQFFNLIDLIYPKGELFRPPKLELAKNDAEDIYNYHAMLLNLRLSPRELKEILSQPSTKQDRLADIVKISRDTLNSINNDVTDIAQLYSVWKNFVLPANEIGISVKNFVHLKQPLSEEALAETLGTTVEEIDNAINSEDDQELADLLGISIEELTVLFGYNILDNGILVNDAAKVKTGGISTFDLIYRPLRLARTLKVNLAELEAVLGFMGIPPDANDPNDITYNQIITVNKHVKLSKLLGLNISQIPGVIYWPKNWNTFLERFGKDQNWIKEYTNARGSEKVEMLATLLGSSQSSIRYLILYYSGGAGDTYLENVSPAVLFTKTRMVSKLIKTSQLIGISPETLHDNLLDSSIRILHVNSFLKLCAIAIESSYIRPVISYFPWLAHFNDFDSIEKVVHFRQFVGLSRYLDFPLNYSGIHRLHQINKWEDQIDAHDVIKLKRLLESRFEEDQLKKELKKPEERILAKTRDALVQFAISPNFPAAINSNRPQTIKDLSSELLIDLKSSPCTMTNEILLAIESLQTYVLRVRTGQEKELDGNHDLIELKSFNEVSEKWEAMKKDWKWMRRYILWEAAQKVFLYPENYVMPHLRDNKSEFFHEFEDELSQGEVTQGLAETSISTYMENLHSISALRVSGSVYDDSKKTLHIFARSQINEKATFHRTLAKETGWSSWCRLPEDIFADKTYPFVAHEKEYLFWVETDVEDESKEKYKHTLSYISTIGVGKWSKKIQIDVTDDKTKYFEDIDIWIEIDTGDRSALLITPYKPDVFIEDVCWPGMGIDYSANSYRIYWNDTCLPIDSYLDYSNKVTVYARCPNLGEWTDGMNFIYLPITARWPHTYATKSNDWLEYEDFDNSSPRRKWIGKGCLGFKLNSKSTDFMVVYTAFQLDDAVRVGEYFKLTHSSINKLRRNGVPESTINKLDPMKDSLTHPVEPTTKYEFLKKLKDLFDSWEYNYYKELVLTFATIGNDYYLFCSDNDRCFIINICFEIGEVQGRDDWSEIRHTICDLNYPYYYHVASTLLRDGINALYDSIVQTDKIPGIDYYKYVPVISQCSITSIPSSSKIVFCGPNGLYNWDLFFHIPYLIANDLSQNRKFELADKWYRYIINPFSDPEPANTDKDVAWQFAPFSEEAIQQLQSFIQDEEDIDIWRSDPFNPHALARVRPGAYQKSVLLSYIENLLEWADQDFTLNTQESINRARNRYLLAEQLLALPEFKQNIPYELQARTLETMNGDATDSASAIVVSAEDAAISFESSDSSCCIPIKWLLPIKTLIDPYSLETMLVNLQVGCIPENPIFESYRRHIESNLGKIRSCRNIAGVQRILPLFEASVDPMAMIRAVSSGAGLENLNLSSSLNVGQYRFGYLIERAKSLANLVAQAGNALLLAIEKKESEELAYLRAQQELNLAKANVHLRKLGIIEAEEGLALARLQTERAQDQKKHFDNLIQKGSLPFEEASLENIKTSIDFQTAIVAINATEAVASAIGGIVGTILSGPGALLQAYQISKGASVAALSAQSSIESSWSSYFSMKAGFERRKEEWMFQRELSEKDKAISKKNEDIAQNRLDIADSEKQIAEMSAEFSDQTLEFLKEKFTNKDLYKWMCKTLSKILYGYYNLAYTTARMAQATLEFERNQSCDFISYGYWDSEKKGLLSGDQLLLDINRMDDAYINGNTRKLEITKHISLAGMVPEALIQLRTEGKAIFATNMRWFDRDFPGHFQRIIKSLRVSVIALVGQGSNINATLSTVSPSQVVINPEEGPVLLQRIQSVALSGASNASGLFELNYRDERYLPFEGCGVAVTWELEMPKPSNRFDFNSIVDVILSMDYTALSDYDYKQNIIQELGTDSSGILPISVLNFFPDTWYHFHNPVFLSPLQGGSNPYEAGNTAVPYKLEFEVPRRMFPPNEEDHSLESVGLLVSLSDQNSAIPVNIKYTSGQGEVVVISRQTASSGFLSLENDFENKSPFGKWEITIDRDRAPEALLKKNENGSLQTEQITDPNNPRYLLDTNLIKDVLISLSYKATLNWPSNL
jgi:Tc toxin complex TcA C-terminal TcB-binding domain/ABC toxin N-terminal region/Neuraminidase-like domain